MGIVGVIGDKMVLNSTPLGGTLILSVLMMPSGIADARDARPAENNILQLSAAMAMPCASGKLSYRQASNLWNSGKSAVSQSSLGVARLDGEAVAAKTGYLAQQVGVAKRRELRLTQAWTCEPLATSDSVRFGRRSVTMMETWCKGQDRFVFGRRAKGGRMVARLSSCKVNWQWRGIPGGFGTGQGYMENISRLTARPIQLGLLV